MRIVGGLYKGRKLNPPRGLSARPTTDAAKEALFNILHHRMDLEGITVLDLFAGTGSVSLEFLSRGAQKVTSIDSDRPACKFMQRMAEQVMVDDWSIICVDVFKFLNSTNVQYDIVFADPPFYSELHEKIVSKVLDKGLLKAGGQLLLEHPKQVDLSKVAGLVEHRPYGTVNFSFFQTSSPTP